MKSQLPRTLNRILNTQLNEDRRSALPHNQLNFFFSFGIQILDFKFYSIAYCEVIEMCSLVSSRWISQ